MHKSYQLHSFSFPPYIIRRSASTAATTFMPKLERLHPQSWNFPIALAGCCFPPSPVLLPACMVLRSISLRQNRGSWRSFYPRFSEAVNSRFLWKLVVEDLYLGVQQHTGLEREKNHFAHCYRRAFHHSTQSCHLQQPLWFRTTSSFGSSHTHHSCSSWWLFVVSPFGKKPLRVALTSQHKLKT